MSGAVVIAGYRKLIRSASKVFGKDRYALTKAKEALRVEFKRSQYVTNKQEIDELIKGIDEADEVLRFNIVQGTLNVKGNYEVKLTEPTHQVTLEAGQCETHGPALEPIDPSLIGNKAAIRIEKVSRKKQ